MKYVMPEPNSGCWLWLGTLAGRGYGSIGVNPNRRHELTHRLSWTLHRGPIPTGLLVLHRCDVRTCVNPDHLYLGTYADNTRDMLIKGRGRWDRNLERKQTPGAIRKRERVTKGAKK